jgi:hypothetical protein
MAGDEWSAPNLLSIGKVRCADSYKCTTESCRAVEQWTGRNRKSSLGKRDGKFWLAKPSRKRRLSLLKLTIRTIPLLALLLLAGVNQASAQGVSAYFGVGSAFDSAGTSAGCPPQQILDGVTGNCEPSNSMGGVFGVFGADFMLKPNLGVNGEYAFRFAQADYSMPFTCRPRTPGVSFLSWRAESAAPDYLCISTSRAAPPLRSARILASRWPPPITSKCTAPLA